jgi:type I restriction enzyme S subunit
VSRLPNGWSELSLIEACKKITDGTHHSPPNKATGEFKYVTAKNIRRHGLDLTDLTYVSAEVHRGIYERCPVEQGDVLYIKDGATTGLAINNPLDEPFSLLSSVALLKPDRRLLDERYLRHWLNSPETLASMTGQMSGSAIKRLTLTTISGQRLPLPPLAEQRRIVAKLDALTARTARARADLDRIPALAARYKQAVLAKAFSGELTAEWRHEHADVAFVASEVDLLKQQRAAYQGGRRGSRLREVPSLLLPGQCADLPTTWASGCVADVANLRVGYAFKSGWFKDVGVPLIRGANVGVGTLDCEDLKYLSLEQARDFDAYRLEEGDILLAMDRPHISAGLKIARVTAGETGALLVQRVASPVPTSLVDTDFLWWLFHSQHYLGQIARHATGSDLPHVSGNDILTTSAPLPPLPEQREIVRRIARSIAEIDRMVAEAAAARRLLGLLDQAVLAKAFRGELGPQDPTDEPASVLLDRIRAERAAAPKSRRGGRAAAA